MRIFAIGDLHLSHTSNKPMDIFGEHWVNHMEQIRQNWEQEITNEDIVLIPGDISWAMRLEEAQTDLDWLDALPGQKICIKGNHDYWWDRTGPLNRLYQQIYFLQNTSYQIGRLAICGTRGWSIGEAEEKEVQGENERLIARECIRLKLSLEDALKKGAQEIWVMLHYPPCYKDYPSSAFVTLLKDYPVTRVIYGHLHSETTWEKAHVGRHEGIEYQLVSADYLAFKPLELTE